MKMDERITANEWDKKKECPICKGIAEKTLPVDGEIMTHPVTGEILHCPICDYPETRLYHKVVIESKKSSLRGDTQPWTHQMILKCDSCDWSHCFKNEVCLGDPHDEVFGFSRPMEQTKEQKHAIAWSGEEAVGLRGVGAKYDKDTKLLERGHREKRKIHTERSEGQGKIEWKPSKEEQKLPRFKKKKQS